jgi:hypothetical protein
LGARGTFHRTHGPINLSVCTLQARQSAVLGAQVRVEKPVLASRKASASGDFAYVLLDRKLTRSGSL